MYKIYVLYYFQVALVKVLSEFTFLESDKNPTKLQLGMSQYRVLIWIFQIVSEMSHFCSVLFIKGKVSKEKPLKVREIVIFRRDQGFVFKEKQFFF